MIHNLTSGGGGTGGTLTITAPAGVTITVTNGEKTKVKTADAQGKATFKGLKTGTWTVTISAGSDTATATVEIVADYEKTMTFFSATIAVTWPEGSTCTCSDGFTTLTAPDTSGSYTFTVPNAGEWMIKAESGSDSTNQSVSITADGQKETVELDYDLYLIKNGEDVPAVSGGWESKTANFNGYSSGNSTISASSSDGAFVVTGKNGYLGTKNDIDLGKYSTLFADIAVTNTTNKNYTRLGIIPSAGVSDIINFTAVLHGDALVGSNTRHTVQLDVQSLEGGYKAALGKWENATVSIYNLWFER